MYGITYFGSTSYLGRLIFTYHLAPLGSVPDRLSYSLIFETSFMMPTILTSYCDILTAIVEKIALLSIMWSRQFLGRPWYSESRCHVVVSL